jgi:lysozyme
MNVVDNWRRIVAISLSFWMQIAGLLVLIIPEVRYMLTGQDSDPYLSWWLGVILLLAGLVGRMFQQTNSAWREWARMLAVIGISIALAFVLASKVQAAPVREDDTLKIAVPFIAAEEGKRNKAYQDIVGVWTICYGSTRGIRAGMVMNDAQCLDLLRDEVAEYRHGLHRYFTPTTKAARLTPARDAAYTSTAFNCGIGAIGKSTATRRLNAGDIAGGCHALTWWNKAGGRVIRGLTNRRAREKALCMQGL